MTQPRRLRVACLAQVIHGMAAGAFLAVSAAVEFPKLAEADFAPLTAIPWEQGGDSGEKIAMPQVLRALYGEPNLGIRYRLLEEYLRFIPLSEMEAAFNLCVPLEGTEKPDHLVAFLIAIWADREPKGCWRWVQKLFAVAGLESDALDLDSWTHEVEVHDLEGVRASSFWIDRSALKGFPLIIDRSNLLTSNEKVEILKEFSGRWFAAFAEWPGFAPGEHVKGYATRSDPKGNASLLDEFRRRLLVTKSEIESDLSALRTGNEQYGTEVVMRRIVVANPLFAPELVKIARRRNARVPSDEFLLLWARKDVGGMSRWVETLLPKTVPWEERDLESYEKLEIRAKGVLLSLVEEGTRERWFNPPGDSSDEEKQEHVRALLASWARWDLQRAIEWAGRKTITKAAMELVNRAVYDWSNSDFRRSRYAFQVLSSFDFSKLPPAVDKAVLGDAYSFMEQWDSIDVASAAKFGLAYLLRTNYAPRKGLIAFFSGKDIYGGEDGMIDRTFCAMRLWAVVRPGEMKEWIKTVDDAELRKALLWLAEHPFGKAAKGGLRTTNGMEEAGILR